jgi:hypothetical protein
MSPATARTSSDQDRLRAIYLSDHLAGAAGGVALARRLEKSHRGTAMHPDLLRLAEEIAMDRMTLREMTRALGLREARYKALGALAAERAGRFKLNGRIRSRSPLSTLVELEALRLGVEGKAAAWRTLRELAEVDVRLSAEQLDGLIERAGRQIDTLEQLRVAAAREALVHDTGRQ